MKGVVLQTIKSQAKRHCTEVGYIELLWKMESQLTQLMWIIKLCKLAVMSRFIYGRQIGCNFCNCAGVYGMSYVGLCHLRRNQQWWLVNLHRMQSDLNEQFCLVTSSFIYFVQIKFIK